MSSYEELVAEIRAALSTVADGKTLTAQGRAVLVEGTAALTAVSRGSTSYQLRTALEALSAAIQAAERAEDVEASVLEAMDMYLAEIGGSGPTVSTALKPSEPAPRVQSSTPRGPDGKIDFRALAARAGITAGDIANRTMERVPDFDPEARNPACWQGLAPRQSNGLTRGNLFFADGRKWNDVLVESTGGQSAFGSSDIEPEYREMKPANGHLEGNVAAWMMETDNRRMVLYLNEHPCRHKGQGCRYMLEHFLPKGYELYVHARRTDGTWFSHLFEGTGKALTTRSGKGDLPGFR